MKPIFLFALVTLALILTACSSTASAQTNPATPEATTVFAPTSSPSVDLTRTDQQGAVVVEITPLNLDNPGQTLDFQVSMNTHSVDLSMDLATLAMLTTDSGNSVQALSWGGPKGGHHVNGKLTFPATANGKLLLEGASQLTLTIKNVDAAARLFTWALSK
jgi:hypothetical protein